MSVQGHVSIRLSTWAPASPPCSHPTPLSHAFSFKTFPPSPIGEDGLWEATPPPSQVAGFLNKASFAFQPSLVSRVLISRGKQPKLSSELVLCPGTISTNLVILYLIPIKLYPKNKSNYLNIRFLNHSNIFIVIWVELSSYPSAIFKYSKETTF